MTIDWRALTAAAVLAAAATTKVASSADPAPSVTVPVTAIGSTVTLVGRLGEPLGTMMDVKGTWIAPKDVGKARFTEFQVTHVNGRKLEKPIAFSYQQVDAQTMMRENAMPKDPGGLDGVSWTLRAFESGRFDGIPQGYWEAFDKNSMAQQCAIWGTPPFTSFLVGVVQK